MHSKLIGILISLREREKHGEKGMEEREKRVNKHTEKQYKQQKQP